jgi:hypothetical protein
MTSNETPFHSAALQIAEKLRQQAHALLKAAETVVGRNSEIFQKLAALMNESDEGWQRIATNRGLSLPAIAFVGERNSGKSRLCELLICHPDARLRLKPSVEESTKTRRLLWIGPQRPPGLITIHEDYWPLESKQMADLGRHYELLDTPGLGDCEASLRALAEKALSCAPFKVLVIDSNRIGAEGYQEHLFLGDGSVVLPVVHLSSERTRKFLAARDEIQSAINGQIMAMRSHLPASTVLDPVLLPDLDSMGDPEAARIVVRDLLIEALRKMLIVNDHRAANRVNELDASWLRFRRNAAELLHSFLGEDVRHAHAKLESTEMGLPIKVTEHLLSDSHQIHALLRMELRMALMEQIPVWAFPFRSLVSVLCFTTGAWDRLILAGVGSPISMVLTGFTALKNVKAESGAGQVFQTGFKARIHQVVSESIAVPLRDFRAFIERAAGGDPSKADGKADFHVSGIADLEAAWHDTVSESTRCEHERSRRSMKWTAHAATAIFAFLSLGPLIHVYGEYVPAVFGSWQGEWSGDHLRSYPAMGGAFWMTVVILSVVPVFILALLLVASRLAATRVKRCRELLSKAMLSQVKAGKIGLRIDMEEPKMLAARDLLSGLSGSMAKL